MSFAVDVNILLYASDRGSAYHERAAGFLRTVAEGDETCYLAWTTVMSYLRMATHPGIFGAPLSPAEAQGNIERLLGCPHVRCIAEDEGFWSIYRAVAGDMPVRGNLVPDAHLAALLKQHGIRTLYSHDRDFRKFHFLRVLDPLAPQP
jgi:toxin-antitoxin system PIN domain toxin